MFHVKQLDFMEEAYKEAKKAYKKDEVPIGAVLVLEGKIIARAHNKKEKSFNPLNHAECIVIRKASKKIKSWRLIRCELYVTLEPCLMCSGAIIQSRIGKVYYGCKDPKSGTLGGLIDVTEVKGFNHYPEVVCLDHQKSSTILKDYFKTKRN